jgi:hypothetical protein
LNNLVTSGLLFNIMDSRRRYLSVDINDNLKVSKLKGDDEIFSLEVTNETFKYLKYGISVGESKKVRYSLILENI